MKRINKQAKDHLEKLLIAMEYKLVNGKNECYSKQYNEGKIEVDIKKEEINYMDGKIRVDRKTTSNLSQAENIVVLECVDRLLVKGYKADNIILEKKYPTGRSKDWLDILVRNNENKSFLMIECKTYGREYNKENEKMHEDGGQLLSYFQQDCTDTKYLCLYTSKYDEVSKKIIYENSIIEVADSFHKGKVEDTFLNWKDNGFPTKKHGIFEEDVMPFNLILRNTTFGDLNDLDKDSSQEVIKEFKEILRHNLVSDKQNAFNKLLNLFICKIFDERNKRKMDEVSFQIIENETDEQLYDKIYKLYKKGAKEFLHININDNYSGQEFAFKEVFNLETYNENMIVVREVIDLLSRYKFKYNQKHQFLGTFFEDLLNTSIQQENGQFFTPVPITKFIISCFPLQELLENKLKAKTNKILPVVIDYASGSGHFLTEYMDMMQKIINNYPIEEDDEEIESYNLLNGYKQKCNKAGALIGGFEWAIDYVYGIEADYRLAKTTKLASFLNGDGRANIIHGNGLDSFTKSDKYFKLLKTKTTDQKDKMNLNFDIVVSNPPYSIKKFKKTIPNGEDSFELYNKIPSNDSKEIESLFVERTNQLLKSNGYAAIILPLPLLTNDGLHKEARKIIIKHFDIIAIASLKNAFIETGVNTAILFLRKKENNEILEIEKYVSKFFIDLEDFDFKEEKSVIKKYIDLATDELSYKDYISLFGKQPTEAASINDLYTEYLDLYNKLIKAKKIKDDFHNFVMAQEKIKLEVFLSLLKNRTIVLNASGKEFLGYQIKKENEGHRIVIIENKDKVMQTKLYNDEDILSLTDDKANYYINKTFLKEDISDVNEKLQENLNVCDTIDLVDFTLSNFMYAINNIPRKKVVFNSKYGNKKINNFMKEDVLEICTGTSFPLKYQGDKNTSHIPYYKVSDMDIVGNEIELSKANNYVSREVLLNDIKGRITPPGTVLFPRYGMSIHTNRKRIASLECSMDQNIVGLRSKNEEVIMNSFILELFNELNLSDLATNGNPPQITEISIREIKLPVTPIEIQREIVRKCNEYLSVIQRINQDISELVKEKVNLVKSYFNNPLEEMGKFIDPIIGGTPPRSIHHYYTGDNLWVKIGEMDGGVIQNTLEKITDEAVRVSNVKLIPSGTTLLSFKLSVGKVAIAGKNLYTNEAIAGLVIKKEFKYEDKIDKSRIQLMDKYIFDIFSSGLLQIKGDEKTLGEQLNSTTLPEIRIPIPDIKLQIEVGKKIVDIEEKIKALELELNKKKDERKEIVLQNI